MKIVIDFTGPMSTDPGGATYANYMLPLWAREAEDELVAVFSRGQLPARLARLDCARELDRAVGPPGIGRALDLHLALPLEVKSANPDAVLFPGNFASIGVPSRIPTVAVLGSALSYHYPGQIDRARRAYRRIAWMFTASRAGRVIVPSSALADDVMRHVGVRRRKIVVIPHGVDLDRFRLEPRSRAEPGRFLFVSRLYDYKGLETALRAVAERIRADPDSNSRLVIADGGETSASLTSWRGLAAALGIDDRVDFLGCVEHTQLADEYQRASALVAPTSIESFGISYLEAAACGCPVITTFGHGIDETIGAVAIQVRAHRHDELAAAMEDIDGLAEGERLELRRRLRAWAERFPWERTLEATRSTVAELVDEGLT